MLQKNNIRYQKCTGRNQRQKFQSVIWKVEKKHPIRVEKRIKKQEDGLRELWDTMKHNNHIIGVTEEDSEQGIENLL